MKPMQRKGPCRQLSRRACQATGIKLMLSEGNTEEVAVSADKPEYRDKIVTKVENGSIEDLLLIISWEPSIQKRKERTEGLCLV